MEHSSRVIADRSGVGHSQEMPRVSIVIPCHNNAEHALECLASVARMDYPNLEIIVVDDGSTDGTAERIARSHPAVTVLRGDGNLWWAGATNMGISEALRRGAEYVLLLNPDCVVAPDLASRLISCARERPGAIIGPRTYDYDCPRQIWFTGGKIDWGNGGSLFIHPGEFARNPADEPISVEWLHALGMLISRPILEKVGLMEATHLPHYWADCDFSLRVRQAGFEVLLEPRARLWNKVESSGITHERARMTWARWKVAFTSVKSNLEWRTTRFFFRRHCPRFYYHFALARFYHRNVSALLRRSLESFVYSHPTLLFLARWLLGRPTRRSRTANRSTSATVAPPEAARTGRLTDETCRRRRKA